MYAPIFLFPVDLRKVTCSELYIYRPVLPPPLARKRQILSRRQKLMKMLVTKISKGKYRNEGQLFAEPISDSNVKLMGEMIALQALRNVIPYDYEVVSKLYNGLVKDLNRISQIDYTITDGYDYAQLAICFLYQFKGHYVSDIYGKDRYGKYITIKTACFRKVDSELMNFRKNIARNRQLEFNHNKHDIPDPRDCFEDKSDDYAKADKLLKDMHLTESELQTLNCCINKMKRSEIAAELGITIHGVRYRKLRIKQKYAIYIGVYKLDRFSRNKYEMAIHRKHLKDNGIKILSAKENIPETPEGVLLESLLEGMNQYYSEELSQKTKRGLRETRIKGNYMGGPINYGYKVVHETTGEQPVAKVAVNEDEAPVLLHIFEAYAAGKRIPDIVRDLDDKGIKNRGNPFTVNSIYFMLQQEKYTGTYTIHGETFTHIYPAIIPKELFQIVRKRVDAN